MPLADPACARTHVVALLNFQNRARHAGTHGHTVHVTHTGTPPTPHTAPRETSKGRALLKLHKRYRSFHPPRSNRVQCVPTPHEIHSIGSPVRGRNIFESDKPVSLFKVTWVACDRGLTRARDRPPARTGRHEGRRRFSSGAGKEKKKKRKKGERRKL